MDIVTAYEQVGTYPWRGGAVRDDTQDGQAGAGARRAGEPLGGPTPVEPAEHRRRQATDRRAGPGHRRADQRQAAAADGARRPATTGSARNFRRAVAEAQGGVAAPAAGVPAVGADPG